jgi:hypothetical protein
VKPSVAVSIGPVAVLTVGMRASWLG